MSNKYVIGDLHIREEEPFFSASGRFLSHLGNEVKNNDTILLLGDIFHRSKPSPVEYSQFANFIDDCRNKSIKIQILQGNHDYNEAKDYFSTDPLRGVEIFSSPVFENKTRGGFVYLYLPWLPKKRHSFPSLREYYESESFTEQDSFIEVSDKPKKCFIFYHFADETISFGGGDPGIDLSHIESLFSESVRMGGDIHSNSFTNYVGVPYQTRYDERGQTGRYYRIDEDTGEHVSIDLPDFLRYEDIEFSDLKSFIENRNPDVLYLITVLNAPSVDDVEISEGGVYLRKVITKTSMGREVSEDRSVESLNDLFSSFATINNVDKGTQEILKSYLEKMSV